MLEIKGFIIVFPVLDAKVSASAKHAFAQDFERCYGWGFVGCPPHVKSFVLIHKVIVFNIFRWEFCESAKVHFIHKLTKFIFTNFRAFT